MRRGRSRRCSARSPTAQDDLGRAAARAAPSCSAPKISFDHAVMERTSRAAVVAADFRLVRHRRLEGGLGAEPAGRAGRRRARATCIPATSPTAICASDGRLLCVLGVDGPRGRRYRRRRAGGADRAGAGGEGARRRARGRGRRRGARPRRGCTGRGAGTRPWTSATAFRVKRIVVMPGKKLSLQKHHHRAEHWVVVRGTAEVTRDARGAAACTRTSRSTCRSAARTGWPTRARFRSRSSRCRPAPTSRRTTSSASRTTSAA